MKEKVYLAIDLGAESGRVMAGLWNGRKLRLEEIHRFANGGVSLGDTYRWDVLRLWAEIQHEGLGGDGTAKTLGTAMARGEPGRGVIGAAPAATASTRVHAGPSRAPDRR